MPKYLSRNKHEDVLLLYKHFKKKKRYGGRRYNKVVNCVASALKVSKKTVYQIVKRKQIDRNLLKNQMSWIILTGGIIRRAVHKH